MTSTISKTAAITAFIRRSVAFHSKLARDANKETIALETPTATRWYSTGTSAMKVLGLKNLTKSRTSLEEDETYCRTSKSFPNFKKIVFDASFWDDLKDCCDMMRPFNFVIALSETRGVSSASFNDQIFTSIAEHGQKRV